LTALRTGICTISSLLSKLYLEKTLWINYDFSQIHHQLNLLGIKIRIGSDYSGLEITGGKRELENLRKPVIIPVMSRLTSDLRDGPLIKCSRDSANAANYFTALIFPQRVAFGIIRSATKYSFGASRHYEHGNIQQLLNFFYPQCFS